MNRLAGQAIPRPTDRPRGQEGTASRHRTWRALPAVALLLVTVWAGLHLVPSTEAIRVRNALLLSSVPIADFDWHPDAPPSGFLAETDPAPAALRRAVASVALRPDDDEDTAKALAQLLTRHARDRGPVASLDIARIYHDIVVGGKGYCADFVETFTGLALAAGLPVRMWSFSFDGFGGFGHVVAEVFDRQHGHWLVLDVYNNVYPVDRATGAWLSAQQLRHALLRNDGSFRFVRLAEGRLGIPVEAKLLDYYRQGAAQWYVWLGNDVFTRGAHPLTRLASNISDPLAQLVALGVHDFPQIAIPLEPQNADAVQRLRRLRTQLLIAALLGPVLLLVVGIQLGLAIRRRRIRSGRGGEAVLVSSPPG